MKFVDSHAHLTSPEVFDQLEGLLERALQAGLERIINICTDIDTLEKGIILSKQYPWISCAAATTPHDASREAPGMYPLVERAAKEKLLVAVGEIGLDYYYEHSDRESQKTLFRRYIALAKETHLPIIIHCRDAFADLFEILSRDYSISGKWGPGVLHCFTGTVDDAKRLLEEGWYISLSGIVTFKKSEELRQVARIIPIDRLLIETDTPYLAPQSKRGKPNEPSYLPETAAVIAQIKGIPLEDFAAATNANASKLFLKPLA